MIVEIQMTVQIHVNDFMKMAGYTADANGVYRFEAGMRDLHQMAREAVLFRLSNGGEDRRTSIPLFAYQVRSEAAFPARGWGSFCE